MIRRLLAVLLAVSFACFGSAQDFFHRPSPFAGSFIVSLATFPEVQKELKLTPDDSKKIDDTLGKVGEDVQGAFQDANGDFGKMQLDIAKIDLKYDTEYLKTLTPDQATRLKQLFVQFTGALVIGREDFASEVGLTDDQKAKVKQLQVGQGKKMADLFQSGGDPSTMGPEMKKLQDQFKVDLAGVLTDDQKKKLEDMKGAKFEFQKDAGLSFAA